jgi:hypothetical protein
MHVFVEGTELESVDIVDLLAGKTSIQVPFEGVVEFVLSPYLSHAAVEDFLSASSHLLAVGIVHDLIHVVPVDQGDEVFGYVYDVLISIHDCPLL